MTPGHDGGGAAATGLADQPARDRIRRDLDTTLIVEAAAGTGKTSELVTRIIACLTENRARLDGIVAVTFTEAAAGELKLRLRAAIERGRHDSGLGEDARQRLEDALPQLEEARIGTIHSFSADLLREHPVAARVDPLFEVAPDDVAGGLFDRAFDRWFERELGAPSEGVRRILRRPMRRDGGPRALLRSAAWDLCERRDFSSPWRAVPFERDLEIDALMRELAALGDHAAAGNADDWFVKSLTALGRFVDEQRRWEAVRGRDHDALEAALIVCAGEKHWKWTGFRSAPPDFPKAELLERRTRLRARLEAFVEAVGADLAPKLRDALWNVVEAYEELKRRAGCLDFIDLLLRSRDLVRDDAAVRSELQTRFTHLFVDEFQDTDPLQVELLLLLASADPAECDWRRVRPVPGKFFLVGDPKQSIYRFRRADVALYEQVKRQLIAAGAAPVHLTVSFRAVPAIQEAVNAAFAPRLRGQSASQAEYVALERHREGVDGQPALVVLPVPAPYGDYGTIVDWRIEESLPDAVAAFTEWLVRQSGWTVTERDAPTMRVPIQPRHVCVLFRRFRTFGTDMTRAYVRALEARQLPHVLLGGSAFHLREEVAALRSALLAIERPEDELMVYATLRGPFFALSDAALLAFRTEVGSLHPFRRLVELPGPLRAVGDALGLLRELHRGRNHRPIADTIGRLLDATRAHAGLAVWPTGEQALANVARLMDLARRAERRGITSFRAFVERLTSEAERNDASEAPIVEEGTEGVRLMTVHRAKGLEFPVVVLADLSAKEAPAKPSRWVDPGHRLCAMRIAGCSPPELVEHEREERERELEEAARLLYVATTRARDLLVVPAIGDARYEGWLGALNPVVYPSAVRAHRPETREPPGCPAFGNDAIAVRPANAGRPDGAVVPGLHVPEMGNHRVVWWDPSRLRLAVEESVGLRQQKLLQVDEGGVRSDAGHRAHAAWQDERTRVRGEGGRPALRVTTATAYATKTAASAATVPADAGAARATPEVAIEIVEAQPGRPRGVRFGALVHAVLGTVDLDADRRVVESVTRVQARLLGAPEAEIDAAAETTVRALAHALLRQAAAAARAGDCRREVPIALCTGDGTLLEGVADLAFRDGTHGGWTVVDFKTDHEIAERLEEYRLQVAVYAAAIARATGQPVRAVLLRV